MSRGFDGRISWSWFKRAGVSVSFEALTDRDSVFQVRFRFMSRV